MRPTNNSNRSDFVNFSFELLDVVRLYALGDGSLGFAGKVMFCGLMVMGEQEPLFARLLFVLLNMCGLDIKLHISSPMYLTVISIILILIGMLLGLWSLFGQYIRPVKQIIVEYSYERISTSIFKSLMGPTNSFWVLPIRIDFTSVNFLDGKVIERRIKYLKRRLKKINSDRETYYCGVFHLPLVALSGYLLRSFKVHFIEIDHVTKRPISLSLATSAPKVHFVPIINKGLPKFSEIALSISLSRKVHIDKIREILSANIPIVNLEASNIGYCLVQTEENLTELTKQFRDLLDELIKKNSNLVRVHMFYAGQTSVLFKFAQCLSSNIDPEIIVYNYTESSYKWGVSINRGGRFVRL